MSRNPISDATAPKLMMLSLDLAPTSRGPGSLPVQAVSVI
jgi:hypothetical protein